MESAQTPQNSEEEPTPKAPVWPRPARELTPSREAARWHQASFSEEKQQNVFKKCVQKLVEEVLIPPKKSFLFFFFPDCSFLFSRASLTADYSPLLHFKEPCYMVQIHFGERFKARVPSTSTLLPNQQLLDSAPSP